MQNRRGIVSLIRDTKEDEAARRGVSFILNHRLVHKANEGLMVVRTLVPLFRTEYINLLA